MNRYVIFIFILVWLVLSSIFYQSYRSSIKQYNTNQYTKLLDNYKLAVELASSKLDNTHLQKFSGLNLSNILEQILEEKTTLNEKILDDILLKRINHQKYPFDNIIFYNNKGEQIYRLDQKKKRKNYANDFIDKITTQHELLYESLPNNKYNILMISPMYSRGNTIIGFIEKSLTFENFKKYFLKNISYDISIQNKHIKKEILSLEDKVYFHINIYPYNKNSVHTLKFSFKNIKKEELQSEFLKKSFYTFFILLVFFYMFYSRFKTMEDLNKVGYFMENSNDELLIISSKSNQIEYVNSTFINNIQYSKKEIIGQRIDLFLEDNKSINYDEKDGVKLKLIRKDNTSYDIELFIKKIDTNKKSYMFIIKDITQEKTLNEKIKLQKEFFRTIIESSPSGIFVKNTKHEYMLANDAMASILGVEDKNLLLEKTNEHFDLPNQLCSILKEDEQKALNSLSTTYKEVQKIKDKYFKIILIPLNNYLYPIKEKMLLGFVTDITSEVAKKNELAKLNTKLKMEIIEEIKDKINIDEKFKTIFNNIHDGMFVYNINEKGRLTKLVSKNKAAKEFLDTYDYNKKDPNDIFEKLSFTYNEKEKSFDNAHQTFIKKLILNDTEHNVKIDAQLIEIAKEFKVIIFVQNIDEKIKLKKEKREQQILIANIFKKAKAGIAIIDKDGKLVKYNQSFYRILGYKRNEFRKQSFYRIPSKESQEFIQKEHIELFKTRKEITNEYIFISKDKNEINVFASSTLIKDGFNETFRLLIFEDITKLKELEFEQMKNSKIIAQQAKMAEMGEMIGAIAHQWRQPLNAINAAAMNLNFASKLDVLKQSDLIEKTEFIEKQSIKMSETINDFMNFFKPSKSKSRFSLEDIYDNICEFIDPQLKNRNINLTLENNQNISMYGFKNEFEHILLNLVNNARDAFENSNNSSKFIKIIGEVIEKTIVIKVIDNAGGIPDSILNKIFNPYFTTKEQGKGTGIGLYMTKTIIEQHFKGAIDVANSDDGAIFTIKLKVE